jgi:omega-amidase
MEPLKITIFQAYIFWENISRNLDNLATRIAALRESTDLIILPEMFNSGFTNNVEKCAESMGGPTMIWMYDMARIIALFVAL